MSIQEMEMLKDIYSEYIERRLTNKMLICHTAQCQVTRCYLWIEIRMGIVKKSGGAEEHILPLPFFVLSSSNVWNNADSLNKLRPAGIGLQRQAGILAVQGKIR